MSSPFSETVSPASFRIAPGHTTHVRVTDSGTSRLVLHTSVTEVATTKAGCAVSQRPVTWARVAPATVALRPGQTRVLTVRIGKHIPRSGHDLAVNAEGARPGHSHVAVVADVASQAIVTGHRQAECRQHVAIASTPASQGSALEGGIGLAVIAVLLVAMALLVRRWRRSPRPARTRGAHR